MMLGEEGLIAVVGCILSTTATEYSSREGNWLQPQDCLNKEVILRVLCVLFQYVDVVLGASFGRDYEK